jgi:WD40 repeat protein
MTRSQWAFLVFCAVGLLTSVGGYIFIAGGGINLAAESGEPGAANLGENRNPLPNEDAEKNPDAEIADPVGDEAKPARTVSRGNLIRKRLSLPDEKTPDGKSTDRGYHVHALCLNPAGTRLVAVSQRNTYCLDVDSGKVLQTFRNELPTNNPRPQYIAASPDARFVIIQSADGKEVTLREAATARVIGTYRLSDPAKMSKLLPESRMPALTPGGEFLLVGSGSVSPTSLHAVSTTTGAGGLVDTPALDLKQRDYKHMLPVPQRSTFIVCGGPRVDSKNHPANVFAVDLASGKERPLNCLGFQPQYVDDRPMVLSPDGNLLLVKGQGAVDVCDWRGNRLLFHHARNSTHFDHACFTADGKRFAVIARSNGLLRFELDPNSNNSVNRPIPDVIELFDVARQEKIGSFTPQDYGFDPSVRSLALSHDGKSFAIWSGTEVAFIDFEAAFGVAPLPPGPRLAGPESLPLKQPAKAEPPRKPK